MIMNYKNFAEIYKQRVAEAEMLGPRKVKQAPPPVEKSTKEMIEEIALRLRLEGLNEKLKKLEYLEEATI